MNIFNGKLLLLLGTVILLSINILPAMAQNDFTVPLKTGTYVKWIERIDLTEAVDDSGQNYAETLYKALVDGINPDSETPYLINPALALHYIDKTDPMVDYYYINVASFSGRREKIDAKIEKAYIYLHTIYEAFTRDCPEAFWLIDESCLVERWNPQTRSQEVHFVLSEVTSSDGELFDIRQDAYRSINTLEAAIRERNQCVKTILAPIISEENRYKQVKHLNRWLTHHNCYYSGSINTIDPSATPDPFRCLSALKGSTGFDGPVCEGYASAFKVLCDSLDIPCVLVDGSTRYGPHIWNYVQMDNGCWYAVDVTLNDPIVKNCSAPTSGCEHEKYLLIGSQTKPKKNISFGESHLVTNMVSKDSHTTAFINGPPLSPYQYSPPL